MEENSHGKIKKTICLRFMSTNNRQMGLAIRMLAVHAKAAQKLEANIWLKIKGICYRIKDSTGRL